MKKITRPKSIGLKDSIKAMKIGSTCEIALSEYKSSVVKTTVYDLNKKGYKFRVTEKGLPNSIKVIRLR